jgi:hypothetical protein
VTNLDGSAYIVGSNTSGNLVTLDIGPNGTGENLSDFGIEPAACLPSFINEQAKLLVGDTTGMLTANYLLEDLGDGTYMFHCHRGSRDINSYFFEVKNGVFTQAGTGVEISTYEYHLTDEDLAKVKAVSSN